MGDSIAHADWGGSQQAPVAAAPNSGTDVPPAAAQQQAMAMGYGPLTPEAAEAVQAGGYEKKSNDPGVRNPMVQVPSNDPSIPEVQNADGSWTLPNGGNPHPITAFNGNQILAGRENPVSYSTATINDENKTINIQVKMDYQTPSFVSRMSGLSSSVTDKQFEKYAGLANAGLAKYWSRTVSLNGSDYAVTVSAQQSTDGMPITLANPGSPMLGDLSSRSRNPYPILTGNLYYDSSYGNDADAIFSMTAAHEIGHGFLTNAFGKDWSWGHEGTSTTMGDMFTNAPQYPATGEIGLMPYYNRNQTTPVYRGSGANRAIG